jgi:hypothetical protein
VKKLLDVSAFAEDLAGENCAGELCQEGQTIDEFLARLRQLLSCQESPAFGPIFFGDGSLVITINKSVVRTKVPDNCHAVPEGPWDSPTDARIFAEHLLVVPWALARDGSKFQVVVANKLTGPFKN